MLAVVTVSVCRATLRVRSKVGSLRSEMITAGVLEVKGNRCDVTPTPNTQEDLG